MSKPLTVKDLDEIIDDALDQAAATAVDNDRQSENWSRLAMAATAIRAVRARDGK